jgi:hypothetical protein
MLLCAASALVACGHGEDDGPQKSANQPPTITGTPMTCITQDNPYEFSPTARDPEGDALSFSITNMPVWSNFNTSNGRLMGIPGAGDVGLYQNIGISVGDGQTSASVPDFSIDVIQFGSGQATVFWTPPTSNDDGSALTDLAAYRVYYGTEANIYPNDIYVANPGIASYVVENLCPNTYYFVLTAINSKGIESGFSNIASKAVL